MSVIEPIARGSEYRCIADFETALVEWETKYGHEFRVAFSESLKNIRGIKDEVFEYRILLLQCVHYCKPKDRANVNNKRKHSSSTILPGGCSAMLRLHFSVKNQVLRITSLIDVHTGHKLEPGQDKDRLTVSDKRWSAKRARLSELGVSPATPEPVQNLEFGTFTSQSKFTKPKVPYPMISALAIHNSPEGRLFTKDIYIFIVAYFPFYLTAYSSWKNSVRHALHTHMYFEKAMVPNKDNQNLMFSNTNIEKLQKDLEKFTKRHPDRCNNIYGLSNPDHWDLMVKGELKIDAITIHPPKVVHLKTVLQNEEIKEQRGYDVNTFVTNESLHTYPDWSGENDMVAPTFSSPNHQPSAIDHQAPMNQQPMVHNPFLPQQAMNMQMLIIQAPFIAQYPLLVAPSPSTLQTGQFGQNVPVNQHPLAQNVVLPQQHAQMALLQIPVFPLYTLQYSIHCFTPQLLEVPAYQGFQGNTQTPTPVKHNESHIF